MYLWSSFSSGYHIFRPGLDILPVCLNSQIGWRHSDLPMIFISKTNDKGVWTLLQWSCLNLLHFNPNVRFCSPDLCVFTLSLQSSQIKPEAMKAGIFLSGFCKSKKKKKGEKNSYQAQHRAQAHTWIGQTNGIHSKENMAGRIKHCWTPMGFNTKIMDNFSSISTPPEWFIPTFY